MTPKQQIREALLLSDGMMEHISPEGYEQGKLKPKIEQDLALLDECLVIPKKDAEGWFSLTEDGLPTRRASKGIELIEKAMEEQ